MGGQRWRGWRQRRWRLGFRCRPITARNWPNFGNGSARSCPASRGRRIYVASDNRPRMLCLVLLDAHGVEASRLEVIRTSYVCGSVVRHGPQKGAILSVQFLVLELQPSGANLSTDFVDGSGSVRRKTPRSPNGIGWAYNISASTF